MIVNAVGICCEWRHLKSTGTIALVVGTWLTVVNQGDVVLAKGIDAALLLKIAVNYLTPFVVSNLGLLARKR